MHFVTTMLGNIPKEQTYVKGVGTFQRKKPPLHDRTNNFLSIRIP